MRIPYTNKRGFKQIREVPEGGDGSRGALVGPPDLSDLGLRESELQELNNLLCDAGLVDYESTINSRTKLIEVVQKFTGNRDKAFMIQILVIYQKTVQEALTDG